MSVWTMIDRHLQSQQDDGYTVRLTASYYTRLSDTLAHVESAELSSVKIVLRDDDGVVVRDEITLDTLQLDALRGLLEQLDEQYIATARALQPGDGS